MNRAALVSVAIGLAVGSFLQGWVLPTLFVLKKIFPSESAPIWGGLVGDGLVWLLLLIGGVIGTIAGIKDWLGRRRTLLINATLLHSLSSVMILWAPDHSVLLASMLLSAFGVGFSFTFLRTYHREITGRIALDIWLPCIAFPCGGVLLDVVDCCRWRLMFGISLVLSLIYLVLIVLLLPESPKWLVSKGLLVEAEQVLQTLHGRDDVSKEMAMLAYVVKLEGGASSKEDCIEQDLEDVSSDNLSKKPVTPPLTTSSQQGSIIESQNATLVDPLLTTTAHGNVDGDSLT